MLPDFTTLLEIWQLVKCEDFWRDLEWDIKPLAAAFGTCCQHLAHTITIMPRPSLYNGFGESRTIFFQSPKTFLLKYRKRGTLWEFRAAKSSLLNSTSEFMRRFQSVPKPRMSADFTGLAPCISPDDNPLLNTRSSTTQILHLIPHRRNLTYFDSHECLHTLTNVLIPRTHSRGDTPFVALFRLSGTGKTQHALEFAYHSRGVFDYIFWIDAQSESEVAPPQ
jgi:hypothetical protein